MPMRLAYARVTGASEGSLHDLFFVEHVKFQYPPSSLLLYSAFSLVGIAPTDRAMNVMVWISILATAGLVFFICRTYLQSARSTTGFSPSEERLVTVALTISTLSFYPIMISWRLGQVQGLLDMLFAAACLCWLQNRKMLVGAFIGATCLIKPQFVLFLVWGVLRRQHRFAFGQAAAFGIGLLFSIMLYGLQAHIDYLEVLTYISRVGEIFWDNTSVNGLVNRLLYPDETLRFNYHGFPPYRVVVHVATLVSSAALISIALFLVGRPQGRGSVFDFMTAGFCFTLASPIAWGHHFGIAMPIFAVMLISAGTEMGRISSRPFLVASLCFLAFSVNWNVTDLLAGTDFTILQSWRLFAAFGMLWLLYRMTSGATTRVGRSRAVAKVNTAPGGVAW